ncbi:hypothetical protein P171DRAFT_236420 [Karstenula rhodostoma CBS 690.94]|uniref:Uncharacterized protein n=1 Tax=Karstenula rhodostoma CBS 690.94 TaxID=1392251 RepID=A0A9P4PPZ3_9PLEO|nr:hypothetical protein P171DRAFT_236420 [Karstenula rhodostoma CBS 690.94]
MKRICRPRVAQTTRPISPCRGARRRAFPHVPCRPCASSSSDVASRHCTASTQSCPTPNPSTTRPHMPPSVPADLLASPPRTRSALCARQVRTEHRTCSPH